MAWQNNPTTPGTPQTPPPNPERPLPEPTDEASRARLEAVRDFASAQYQNALTAREAPQSGARLIERLDGQATAIADMQQKIDERLERARKLEAADGQLSGLVGRLEQLKSDLAFEGVNITGMRRIASTIDQWERGNLPPTELRDWIATMHGDVDIGSREWSETDPRHTVADLDAAIAATRGHA
ncbi:MAG: hypothetical protein KBC95_05205, partial [Candidatus Peribacteraceae bacterium]|nr:hypothetical protein [Candidatus Peribacteraceae bacterium]